MAHFYFDLCNSHGLTADEQGRDLPDLASAERAAVEEIRDVAAGDIREGNSLVLSHYISVRDAGGTECAKIEFSQAIDVRK